MQTPEFLHEVSRLTGLNVTPANSATLLAHIRAQMRARGFNDEQAYLDVLAPESVWRANECRALAKLLTTHETYFMRDANQMALLQRDILPALIAARRKDGELTLRIWSCGCASGEEPASLAIILHQLLPDAAQWRIEIVATDISDSILERARNARYGEWSFRGCDDAFRALNFRPRGGQWQLLPSIRKLIRYARLDLLQDPLPNPAKGYAEFDLIVCRNVFIYFQPWAIDLAAVKLAACLRTGAALITGHGELRAHRPDSLVLEMHPESFVYRKSASPHAIAATGLAKPAAVTRRVPCATDRVQAASPLPLRPRQSAARPEAPLACTIVPRPEAAWPAADRPPADRRNASDEALERAWRLADEGRLEAARHACARVLADDALNAGAHFLEAVLATELGDAARARSALRGALYLDPDMIAAHVHLERQQTQQANIQSANKTRETIRRLIAALPADTPIPYMRETRAADLAGQLAASSAGASGAPD